MPIKDYSNAKIQMYGKNGKWVDADIQNMNCGGYLFIRVREMTFFEKVKRFFKELRYRI